MGKKILIGVVCVIIFALSAFAIFRWVNSHNPGSGSELKNSVKNLNENIDFKLLLYGDDIDFPDDLNYQRINSLDENTWQLDNDYVFLIINDYNSNVTFNKNTYLKLKKYADENTNFNFYYLGTDDLDMIQRNTLDTNFDDDDMSFGYMMYEGKRIVKLGIWTKNDDQYLDVNPNLFGENIFSSIEWDINHYE